MARRDAPIVRNKEQQALELKLAGKTFEEIAEIVGYSGRQGASQAFYRGLNRTMAADATEIRDIEGARIDAMIASIWPMAISDPELVRATIDKAGLIPLRDDSNREIVYVVPPKAQLESIEKSIKLMERKSRFYGLDHADGLAERQVALSEQLGDLLVAALPLLIEGLGLNAKQKARVPKVVESTLRELAAS